MAFVSLGLELRADRDKHGLDEFLMSTFGNMGGTWSKGHSSEITTASVSASSDYQVLSVSKHWNFQAADSDAFLAQQRKLSIP